MQFLLWWYNDRALKRFFFIQESKVLVISFCVVVVTTRTLFFANSDPFRRGTQPVQLSQSDCYEGPRDLCSDQEFTTWRIVVVPSAQWRGPEWFHFGQNRQRDEIQLPAAEFYVRGTKSVNNTIQSFFFTSIGGLTRIFYIETNFETDTWFIFIILWSDSFTE